MFNSNTQPKRIVKEAFRDDWYCHKCDAVKKHYYGRCPSCGSRRAQDDDYRKGGNKWL